MAPILRDAGVYRRELNDLLTPGLGMLKEYEFFEYVRRDVRSDPRHTRADYTPAEQSFVTQLDDNAKALIELYAKIEPLQKLPQRTATQEAELATLRERRNLNRARQHSYT